MDETRCTANDESLKSPEIKLTCKTLFNKQGELSSFRCALFSIKVFLWYWLFLILPAIALGLLLGLFGSIFK